MSGVCEFCDGEIPRPPGALERRWLARRYCSFACANKARTKPKDYEHPPCERCGGPVVQRPGEDNGRYKKRRFCSRECVHGVVVANASAAQTRRAQDRRSWPDLTGSRLSGQVFAAYDRDPGDGGLLNVLPPPTTPLGREANS
jgi:hypothetical protein